MEPHLWIAAQSKLLTLYFIGETIEIRTEVVFESYNNNLKVVCNEKQRVDGRWYTLGTGTRPWKLMFIYRLTLFMSMIPNFKLLRSPVIDSEESILPAYVAWPAGTTTLFLLGS